MAETPPTEKVVKKASRAWKRTKWALLGVLVVLVLIVLFQNYQTQATISALFWKVDVRIYVPMLIALALGALTGLILCHVLRKREQ